MAFRGRLLLVPVPVFVRNAAREQNSCFKRVVPRYVAHGSWNFFKFICTERGRYVPVVRVCLSRSRLAFARGITSENATLQRPRGRDLSFQLGAWASIEIKSYRQNIIIILPGRPTDNSIPNDNTDIQYLCVFESAVSAVACPELFSRTGH